MNKIDYSISLNETNALKGVAIIAMLLHHLFYTHPEYGVAVQQIGLIGKACVAMFLFLSGYGLTVQFCKTLKTNDINKGGRTLWFLYKRFVKFYLNYWVIFLIFVPIGVFGFGRGLEVPYGEDSNIPLMLFKDFLGINSMQSYNITWWFNKLIIRFYLFFPLYFTLLQSRNRYVQIAAMLYSFLDPSTFAFVAGIFIATEMSTINEFLNRLNAKIILCLSILMTLGFTLMRQLSPITHTNGLYADVFITVSAMLMMVAIARLRHKEYNVLSFIGKHSMNMYMVHTFIFAYFFKDFIYGFKYPLFIFLALLATSLAVSIVIEFSKDIIYFYKLQNYLLNIFNKK